MGRYTHWLVTKGKDPTSVGRRGLVPIVMMCKSDDVKDLRRMVQAEIDQRIRIFLQDNATAMEVLRASSRSYVAEMLNDLWLRDVRLSWRPGAITRSWGVWGPDETVIAWTLVGDRIPEEWQGPADGVIPAETPLTIFAKDVPAVPFKLVED